MRSTLSHTHKNAQIQALKAIGKSGFFSNTRNNICNIYNINTKMSAISWFCMHLARNISYCSYVIIWVYEYKEYIVLNAWERLPFFHQFHQFQLSHIFVFPKITFQTTLFLESFSCAARWMSDHIKRVYKHKIQSYINWLQVSRSYFFLLVFCVVNHWMNRWIWIAFLMQLIWIANGQMRNKIIEKTLVYLFENPVEQCATFYK